MAFPLMREHPVPFVIGTQEGRPKYASNRRSKPMQAVFETHPGAFRSPEGAAATKAWLETN